MSNNEINQEVFQINDSSYPSWDLIEYVYDFEAFSDSELNDVVCSTLRILCEDPKQAKWTEQFFSLSRLAFFLKFKPKFIHLNMFVYLLLFVYFSVACIRALKIQVDNLRSGVSKLAMVLVEFLARSCTDANLLFVSDEFDQLLDSLYHRCNSEKTFISTLARSNFFLLIQQILMNSSVKGATTLISFINRHISNAKTIKSSFVLTAATFLLIFPSQSLPSNFTTVSQWINEHEHNDFPFFFVTTLRNFFDLCNMSEEMKKDNLITLCFQFIKILLNFVHQSRDAQCRKICEDFLKRVFWKKSEKIGLFLHISSKGINDNILIEENNVSKTDLGSDRNSDAFIDDLLNHLFLHLNKTELKSLFRLSSGSSYSSLAANELGKSVKKITSENEGSVKKRRTSNKLTIREEDASEKSVSYALVGDYNVVKIRYSDAQDKPSFFSEENSQSNCGMDMTSSMSDVEKAHQEDDKSNTKNNICLIEASSSISSIAICNSTASMERAVESLHPDLISGGSIISNQQLHNVDGIYDEYKQYITAFDEDAKLLFGVDFNEKQSLNHNYGDNNTIDDKFSSTILKKKVPTISCFTPPVLKKKIKSDPSVSSPYLIKKIMSYPQHQTSASVQVSKLVSTKLRNNTTNGDSSPRTKEL